MWPRYRDGCRHFPIHRRTAWRGCRRRTSCHVGDRWVVPPAAPRRRRRAARGDRLALGPTSRARYRCSIPFAAGQRRPPASRARPQHGRAVSDSVGPVIYGDSQAHGSRVAQSTAGDARQSCRSHFGVPPSTSWRGHACSLSLTCKQSRIVQVGWSRGSAALAARPASLTQGRGALGRAPSEGSAPCGTGERPSRSSPGAEPS